MIVNYDCCIEIQRAGNADERDDDIVIRQDEKLTISTLPMAYSVPTIQSQA